MQLVKIVPDVLYLFFNAVYIHFVLGKVTCRSRISLFQLWWFLSLLSRTMPFILKPWEASNGVLLKRPLTLKMHVNWEYYMAGIIMRLQRWKRLSFYYNSSRPNHLRRSYSYPLYLGRLSASQPLKPWKMILISNHGFGHSELLFSISDANITILGILLSTTRFCYTKSPWAPISLQSRILTQQNQPIAREKYMLSSLRTERL